MNAAAKPHSPPAILVIDDDAIMRDLMGDWLEAAGYHVIKAMDCDDALEQVQALRPAVVVTDMFMPGPCGEALLAEIRQALPDVAIVAVSGHFKSGHGISGDRAIAAGADRALAKPVQRSAFLKAVAELLHV
ncbi:MAG TPA: response regulator [Burkholderiales bacterium]|nr:response regulator [Burkholderiales bacterium]